MAVGAGKSMRVRPGEEIWEGTTASTVWVEASDEKGRTKSVMVRGFGRLRITAEDREINQEMCVEPDLDPFLNGLLIRVDSDQQEVDGTKSTDAKTTEELVDIFAKPTAEFEAEVASLGEVPVRRMLVMAPDVDASIGQVDFLRRSIETRWPVGGDVPSYRELKQLDTP